MKKLLLILTTTTAWAAGTSIHLENAKVGTATLDAYPNSAQFRVEFRMDNRTLAAGAYIVGLQIPGVGNFNLQRGDSGTNASCVTGVATPLFINVDEVQDFEVRMQRTVTTPGVSGTFTCEAWDISTSPPTLITSQTQALVPGAVSSGTMTLGSVCTISCGSAVDSTFELAYLRVFSTVVATGGTPPALSTTPGDLYNYEFEGSTTTELGDDTSSGPTDYNLAWDADVTNCPSGGGTAPCTVSTPLYPAACDAGASTTFRAGELVTATGAASYSRNEGPLFSYSWGISEHPANVSPVIVNNDTTSPTISLSNTVFGQYTLTLTVTDAAGPSSCSVDHGVSIYTTDGAVLYPSSMPSEMQTLLGPVIAVDMGPLEWLEFSTRSAADEFDSRWGTYDGGTDRSGYWDDDPDAWGGGTVDISQSDTTTGVGSANDPSFTVDCTVPGTCNFRSTVCDGSGAIASPASWVTGIFINYPAYEGGYGLTVQGGYAAGVPMSSGETGWLKAFVASCPSDDQLLLSWGAVSPGPINIGAPKGTVMAGRNWSWFVRPINVSNPIQAWAAAAPSAVDFYDSALGYYGMYYRTGLTKYLTRARYITDRHYSNATNMNKGFPYRIGIDCGPGALTTTTCDYNDGDGQDPRDGNYTSVIIRALDGKPEYWTGIRRVCGYYENSATYSGGAGDREHGYATMFIASCALADPDPTFKARWLTELDLQIDGYEATVCTEANETSGALRPCNGRWLGQWVYPTSNVAPGPWGLGSAGAPASQTYTGWKVRMENGSSVATLINGPLAAPSTNSALKALAEAVQIPISFGPDQTMGALCVASGAVGSMTCGTTPPTTSYTDGLIIVLRPPTTITGATAPFINVDGLGSKAILNWYPPETTTWSANSHLTAGMDWALRYSAHYGKFVQVPILTTFYPITEPSFGADVTGDVAKVFVWPERLSSTTFRMKEYSLSSNRAAVSNYTWNACDPGPTCDLDFRWDFAVNLGGGRVQPFMLSIIMMGLDTAYEATVAAGAPDSRIPAMISDAAKWLVDYAYDPSTGGLYFARGAGCDAESGYGVMPATFDLDSLGSFTPLTSCASDVTGARAMSAEVGRAMTKAYVREADATRKENIRLWMHKVFGKAYGKVGYDCGADYLTYCHDGSYFNALEITYTGGAAVDKWLGFAIGFGGDLAWPSGELYTEWPRVPPTRTAQMSFKLADISGANSVRVQIKDQGGVTLDPTDCASSPCEVTIPDTEAGTFLFKLEYRASAGGTILAAGDWQPLYNKP